MPVGGEKFEQAANLRFVRTNRVRAAVGFELKPADVFVRCGLQGEWHVEAAPMIIDAYVGALRVASPRPELELPQSDGFGFDPEFTDRVKNVALWFYRNYWRVDTDGVTNVPSTGPGPLVANPGGLIPYDGHVVTTTIIA